MSPEDTFERSMQIIPFNGKDSKWREWNSKTIAIARRKGWYDILIDEVKIDRTSKTTEELERIKNNDEAYNYFILSCTEAAFPYIESANGSAHIAYSNLCERYESNRQTDLLTLHSLFLNCIPTDENQDPSNWFWELEYLRKRIQKAGGGEKHDSEIIAHVLKNAPHRYSTLCEVFASKKEGASLKDIRLAFSDHWHRNQTTEQNKKERRVALYTERANNNNDRQTPRTTTNRGKRHWQKFKGNCTFCGKIGHKAIDCRQKQQQRKPTQRSNSNVTCYKCGKKGHWANECKQQKGENNYRQPQQKSNQLFSFIAEDLPTNQQKMTTPPPLPDLDERPPSFLLYGICHGCTSWGLAGTHCGKCDDLSLTFEGYFEHFGPDIYKETYKLRPRKEDENEVRIYSASRTGQEIYRAEHIVDDLKILTEENLDPPSELPKDEDGNNDNDSKLAPRESTLVRPIYLMPRNRPPTPYAEPNFEAQPLTEKPKLCPYRPKPFEFRPIKEEEEDGEKIEKKIEACAMALTPKDPRKTLIGKIPKINGIRVPTPTASVRQNNETLEWFDRTCEEQENSGTEKEEKKNDEPTFRFTSEELEGPTPKWPSFDSLTDLDELMRQELIESDLELPKELPRKKKKKKNNGNNKKKRLERERKTSKEIDEEFERLWNEPDICLHAVNNNNNYRPPPPFVGNYGFQRPPPYLPFFNPFFYPLPGPNMSLKRPQPYEIQRNGYVNNNKILHFEQNKQDNSQNHDSQQQQDHNKNKNTRTRNLTLEVGKRKRTTPKDPQERFHQKQLLPSSNAERENYEKIEAQRSALPTRKRNIHENPYLSNNSYTILPSYQRYSMPTYTPTIHLSFTAIDSISEEDAQVAVQETHSFLNNHNSNKTTTYLTEEEPYVAAYILSSMNRDSTTEEPSEHKQESWLFDSGATVHITNNPENVYNKRLTSDSVMVGNSATVNAIAIGDILLQTTNGEIELKDVLVIPKFTKNILSMSKIMQVGCKVSANKNTLYIRNWDEKVALDRDNVTGMYFLKGKRLPLNQAYTSKRTQSMDINVYHDLLGHAGETTLRKTASLMKITLTGKLKSCDGCMKEKAKQKATAKETKHKAIKAGERIYMDTSGPYPKSINGNKYWLKFCDQFTGYSWNCFIKSKGEVHEYFEQSIIALKAQGHMIRYLRCDNAGEHLDKLREVCNKYGIYIEYTTSSTPEFNAVVERRFFTDKQRGNAMMFAACLDEEHRNKLWEEAYNTATIVGNIIVPSNQVKTPYELFYGKISKLYNNLIQFGRIGYITKRAEFKPKLRERSKKCIFIGYPPNHSADSYKFYNPKTNATLLSRDVRWADWERSTPKLDMNLFEKDETVGIEDNEVGRMENPEEEKRDNNDEPENTTINDNETRVFDLEEIPIIRNNETETTEETTETAASHPEPPTDETETDIATEDEDSEVGRKCEEENNTSSGTSESTSKISRELKYLGTDNIIDVDLPPNVRPTRNNYKRNEENNMHILRSRKYYGPKQFRRNKNSNNNKTNSQKGLKYKSPTPTKHSAYMTEALSVSNTQPNLALATLSSDPGEPKSYSEAIGGNRSRAWRASMELEIKHFLNRKAWIPVPRSEAIDQHRKIIPTKWIYKIKSEQNRSLRLKSRVVTKGFHQIPGVDYTDTIAAVSPDSAIRMLIALGLYQVQHTVKYGDPDRWVMEVFDVEAAFLNADLATPIYIEWPEGITDLGFITEYQRATSCIKLVKAMYGNIDSPLRWLKTFTKILKAIGLTQCESDPCSFYQRDEKNLLKIALSIYVDDSIIIGSRKDVDQFYSDISKYLKIEKLGRLKKHLGVWYSWCRFPWVEGEDGLALEGGFLYLRASMPQLVQEIQDKFEETWQRPAKRSNTPGKPGYVLPPNTSDQVIRLDEYRSIVGKIIYLMTKVAPEISNATREVASHMANPGAEQWKAVERIVGYLSKDYKGLVLRCPDKIRPYTYVDSDFAKAHDRKSITGRISTLGGFLTSWSSKKQVTVALSSTEAEYQACSSAAAQVKFERQYLKELLGKDQLNSYSEGILPGVIYNDNTGAISLVRNMQTNARTKHIDIRYHFIRQLHEDGEIQLTFVRSARNCADICTKNLPESLFRTHTEFIKRGYCVPTESDNEERISEIGTFAYRVNNFNPWWDNQDTYTDLGGRISRQQ